MANYDFARKRGEVVSEEEKKQRKITYDFTKPKPGTESLFKPETVSPVTVDTKFEQLMQPEVSVAPAVPKESAYTRIDQKLGGFLPFGAAIPKYDNPLDQALEMSTPQAVKPSPAIDPEREWQEMVVQSMGQPVQAQDKQYSLDNPLLRALKLSTQDNIGSALAEKILGPDPTRIEPQTDFERGVQSVGGFVADTAIGGKILEGFAPIVKGGLKKAVDMVKRMPLWAKATGGAAGTAAAVDAGIGAFTPDKEDRDFLQSVGASVRAGVGDTLAMAGGTAKWKGKEGLGEALETKGAEIRRGFEDVSRVPEEEISWRSFFNPDFYSGNVARSLPTTLALVPAMFAGYKLGGAAGAKAGLGAFGRAVLGSLTGAGVSRPLESAMEAGAAYSEALERGYEPDKAEEIAQSIFDKNLRMWGLDAAQLAAAFVPAPFKPVGKLGKVAMGAGRLGGVGVVEGLEESAQEVFQQQAFGDDRGFIEQMLHPTQAQKEAAFVGGVFGVGMGGAGVVTDVMREIKTRTLETMPPEMQTEVRHHAEHLERNEGLTADESIDRALETIAETEEGQKVIDQAVQGIVDDVNSGRLILPILGNIEPYSAPVVTEPVAAPVEPAAEVPASVSPVVTPTAALPEPAVATPAIVPEVTIPAPITPEPAGTAKVPEAVVHPAPVTPPAPVVESEPVTKAEAPTAPAEGKAIGKDVKQPKPAEAAKGPAPSPEFARTGEKVEIRVEVEPGKYKWEPATIERVVKNTKGEDLYEVRWNETVVRLNQDDVRPIKVDVTSKQKAPEAKTKQEPIPAEEKPTVVKRDRTTASTADLAADYKARGMSRQRAWSQFVIDKSLRPGIDAKEFYKVFDSVPLKLFKEVDVQGDVKATHILKETYTPERRVQILNETEGYVEWVDEHGTVGSTPREFIESLKSVSTEQETSTTNKKETRKRGFDKSPKEVLKEYGLQIVKTKDERDGRTAWQVKGKGARELKDVLKELGAKSINTSINEKAAWTFYGEEDPSVRILERVQQGATVTEPQSLEELQKQIIKASPGKIGKEKAEALGVLIRGVASYRGLDPDEYVRQRFRGVVLGGTPATDALLKRMAEDDKNMSMEPAAEDFTPPKKTIKAYKLFRTMKSQPGKIFPLFIGKSKPTPIGEWIEAEHIPTKGYAERPGWHAGILPYAPHLMKKDGTMQEGRVWAEVELPADVDWQPIADTTKTKDVRDRIPVGGHYRFKTNKMQGGAWIIGGAIKVNKILSPEEVREILKKGAPELLKTVEGVPVASVEFDEDARALIRALKAPDVAAMAHELGHVFRRDLSPGDLAIAEEWAGVEDGVWTQDAEEKFAEGFEKYLMDGKAPSPGLKQVFEKFKKWLTEIYKKLKNTQLSVELSDPMREVFDRLIGGKKLNVKLMGKTATAKTERGTAIEAQYAVVPAYELITSHNIDLSRNKAYPKELQPRQRERAASEDQINRIAANLEPEFLGESPKVSEGAPIVGEDMIVESGNGRVIALKRVYQKGDENADKYREWLVANAEKLGFNKEGFKEIENPTLVRIRLTDVDRVKFTQEANEQTVAALSATEQAAVDSKKLTGDILNFFAPSETGEINTRANRGFIRLFVEKVVSPSDRGRFITSDGSLSQEGITRIRNAVYAKAYGDIAAIEKLAESTDNNVRNITNAMLMAAPKIAKVKEGIRKGSLYDLDISKDITDAMKKLSHLRESGTAVQDYLNQTALFGEDISPLAKDLLSAFDVNKRYVKRIAALLNNYADAVFSIGDPKQMSMFEASKPTKAEVLLTAIRKVAREYEGQISDQASLFQDEAVRGEADRGGIGEAHEKEGGSRQEEVSSYESAKAKLEAKTSEAIGDVNPPVGFSVRVVGGKGQAQADTGEFHIENEEIRKRFEAAKGVPKESFLAKARAFIRTMWHQMTREYEHLPRNAEFSPLRTDLLRLAKQKGVRSDEAIRIIQGIAIGLNKRQFNAFRHYVILADLMEELEAGHALPFGFNKETLEHEWDRINEYIENEPEIKKAIEDRKAIWGGIIDKYIAAQERIGHHVAGKFKRHEYYRHQVLEYAQAKSITGTGKKLKTPVGRGFLKRREGSTLDINTDYLEAEFEVMSRMLYDIEVADTIYRVGKRYNIRKTLEKQAKKANEEAIQKIIGKQDKTSKAVEEQLKKYKQMIAMSFSQLRKLAESGKLWEGKNGEYAGVVSNLSTDPELEASDRNKLFYYLSDLISQDTEGSVQAATILKAVSHRAMLVRDVLGKNFKTWENTIPEGYVTWQPREGNLFYFADTIPAQLAEQLYGQLLEKLEITASQLRKVLVLGGKRMQFVVKKEVAATLDDLVRDQKANPLLEPVAKLQRGWKAWQLISPRRWFKYNFRNISGDAEAAFVGNPVGFTKVSQAAKELYPVFAGDKPMTPNMKDWFERGGIETLLQAQELSDVSGLRVFTNLVEKKGGFTKLPAKAWQRYWKAARLSTDFREAILRYANYLSYLEQMQKSPDGKPKNYGASIREEIMALDDIKDRAFKLSNELLGAYDQVGVVGQELRKYLIPFWSWNEVNFRRTKQLFLNAAQDSGLAKAASRKVLGTMVIRSPFLAYNIGKFFIKAFAFWTLLQLWNEWKWPEEEASLPESVRAKPHIIFGRDEDGKVIYFERLGFVQDFLEWFGIDESLLMVRDWLNGKRTLKEIGEDMAKSPFIKLVNSIGPVFKTPAELLMGYSLFPDFSKPRKIRDRWEYIFDNLGLENEYRYLTGKPVQTFGGSRTEGYWRTWRGAFIYSADPAQSAYYDTLDEKRRFMKKLNKPEGFSISPKSNALYNYKLSIRYKDKEAAQRYLMEYIQLGGTKKGLASSIESMHPLYGLSKKEQAEFVRSLDAEDKQKLIAALRYFETTLKGR